MSSTLFILGRTPDLAFLELKTFFPTVSRLAAGVALIDFSLPVSPHEVLGKLGGTVKIGEKLGEVSSITAETIAAFVDTSGGRTVFGVSVYGEIRRVNRMLLEEVKMLLEGRGASVRFIEAKSSELSSVVVEKNNVQEIVFIKVDQGYVVGRTSAVQPFEAWNDRDFGRPYADPKAGMLPPKVARMAVNIAGVGAGHTLLDPFCGMGTILTEGLFMGWNVVGGDQDVQVVEKARGNLRWFMGKNKLGVTYRLVVSDAVHVSEKLDRSSIDAIVTEPFMGPPHVKDVRNTIKGLEKLYIGCLRDWQKVLKRNGVVVMAIPKYEINEKTYFVKKVIDMCENLGYTIQAGPIEYGRRGATVKRLFYLFQKK